MTMPNFGITPGVREQRRLQIASEDGDSIYRSIRPVRNEVHAPVFDDLDAPIPDRSRRLVNSAVNDRRDAGFLRAKALSSVRGDLMAPVFDSPSRARNLAGGGVEAPVFDPPSRFAVSSVDAPVFDTPVSRRAVADSVEAPVFDPPPRSSGVSAGVLKNKPVPDGGFSYTYDTNADWKQVGQDLADGADPNAMRPINITGHARSSTGDGPAGMQQWNDEERARRNWQREQVAARGGVPLGSPMPDPNRMQVAADAKQLRADLAIEAATGQPNATLRRDIAVAGNQRADAESTARVESGANEVVALRAENARLMAQISQMNRGRSLDQADARLDQNQTRLNQNQQRIDNGGRRGGQVGPPAPETTVAANASQTGQPQYSFTRQPAAGRIPAGARDGGNGTIIMNGARYARGTNNAGQSGWVKVQ